MPNSVPTYEGWKKIRASRERYRDEDRQAALAEAEDREPDDD